MDVRANVLLLALDGEDPASVRYFDGISRTLDPARFRLVLGTIRNPGLVQERAKGLGHATFCLDCHSRWGYPRAVFKLVRLIRCERIDVLHGNEELGGFLCGLAGTFARRPVRIYHRHHDRSFAYDPNLGPKGTARQRLMSYVHTANYRFLDMVAGFLADRILTVSENHRLTVLCEQPGWNCKLGVALNGVDVPEDLQNDHDTSRRIRDEVGAGSDKPVLTIVARLNWRKGHAILFDALQQLKSAAGLEPILFVVGYGPMDADLKARARRLELLHVHFVGMQDNIIPWFLAADVAVIPSLVEPFGLTAAEAMACARPVIASRVGGLQEIVNDGVTGLLVPPGESVLLARAITHLLASPASAAAMGRRGRERYVREFSQEAMTRRWEQHYTELLASRRASGKAL